MGTRRFEAVPRPPRDSESERISVTFPVALISIGALLVAAVPLLLVDPRANEGVAVLVAVLGIPALASAVVVEVVRRPIAADRRLRPGWLWWLLGVVPLGIVLCSIPAIQREPEYFVAESLGTMLGTLALMLVMVYLGLLLGALVWFFVVFPVVHLAKALMLMARGERSGAASLVMPLAMLTLTAIIIVGALSLDDLLPGRMAGGQIVMALLGVPGSYEVVWPAGLWIVRGLVMALILAAAAPKIRRHFTGAAAPVRRPGLAGTRASAPPRGRDRPAGATPKRRPRR